MQAAQFFIKFLDIQLVCVLWQQHAQDSRSSCLVQSEFQLQMFWRGQHIFNAHSHRPKLSCLKHKNQTSISETSMLDTVRNVARNTCALKDQNLYSGTPPRLHIGSSKHKTPREENMRVECRKQCNSKIILMIDLYTVLRN